MKSLPVLVIVASLAASTSVASDPAAGIRGDAAAVAAARRLLEQVGGADAWRARTFDVSERVYPASGQAAQLRVVRDFSTNSRLMTSTSAVRTLVVWVSPDGGWTRRNDEVTVMSPETLAGELQGLRQEPYAIYHRIARDDAGLRVELRDGTNLYVFDQDERLLSWFQLAPNGTLLGWGCFFDGAINQHYYGPLAEFSAARLPKFGATSNGTYRFEYLAARFSDEPLQAPSQQQ